MKKEIRTVVYDESLRIEAYRFEGIVQPFPNHFHEHYVIGFVEDGERCLSCKNIDYTIGQGDVVLFNPGDNHACVQCGQTGLSKSTLLRAFTKSKGITPYRYLETIRVNEAKKLLSNGVSVLDAAIRTGFFDQCHFTNYFTRFIGLAPGVYRIYMVPVITVITSMLVLKETVTFLSISGTILAVVELFLSEYNKGSKK